MKVYLFITNMNNMDYLNLPDMGDTLDDDGDTSVKLYAYTNKKFERKEFKRARNMNFFSEVVREMDDYEYEEFQQKFPDTQLKVEYLLTKNKGEPNKPRSATVVCTERESELIVYYPENVIEDRLSILFSSSNEMLFKTPFKGRVRKALNTLGILSLEVIGSMDVTDEYSIKESGLELDELNLFIEEYIGIL